MIGKSLKDRFLVTIEKYGMLASGDSVLIALSGGIDSTVMIRLFDEVRDKLDLTLYAFHLNHKLRGSESDSEAEFVRTLCEDMSIKAFVEEYDISGYAESEGLSIQLAARNIRYKMLNEIKRTHNIDKIATAHNADDRAETVLIRLIRGTAGTSIAGIPAVRDGYIIRPLIETFRAEIEEYAGQNKVRYKSDSSNEKTDYLRNRVRLELIPHLAKEYNKNILTNLFNFSTIANLENELIGEEVKVKYEEAIMSDDGNTISFSATKLNATSAALLNRIIVAAFYRLAPFGDTLSYRHIEKVVHIVKSAKPNLMYNLPGGISVVKSYDTLTFSSSVLSAFPEIEYEHGLNDSTLIEETGVTVRSEPVESGDVPGLIRSKSPNEEFLDADKLTYPLTIRNFKNGDSIRPLNMTGTKKLKDIFIDRKVRINLRRTVPVIVSGDDIVMVSGIVLSDDFKVTEKTISAVRFSVE